MTLKTDKTWIALDIVTEPGGADAAEFALNELECLGSEIDNLRKSPSEPVCVTGFFDAEPKEGDVRTAIEYSARIHGVSPDAVISVTSRVVEETDWLAEWKKHWSPVDVAGFTISAMWCEIPPGEQTVIRIEPNMAFGTGTHETTQLCLKAIDQLYSPEQSFLDVGTGTGILAIAAAKMGGRDIYACDVDHDSVGLAVQNARENDVEAQITFREGSITAATPTYDFVTANLTLDVIIPLLPLLIEKTGTTLLLSGVLAQQETEALAELGRLNVKDLTVNRDGEWIAIIAVPGQRV